MLMKNSCLILLLGLICFQAGAQKQLVLLKKQQVLLRLYPGDEIVFKLKGDPSVKRSYVNNLFKGAVQTHRDSIPFHQIERIYFKRSAFYNRVGQGLVILGAGLFVIDQVNVGLIQGDGFSFDSGVSKTTVASVGVGLPMMLIKKKSQKLKPGYTLLTVEKGSAFYREDNRTVIDDN